MGPFSKEDIKQILGAAAVFAVAGSMAWALLSPGVRGGLAAAPDTLVGSAWSAEQAIGAAYWAGVGAYVQTTYQALDAAAAVYGAGVQGLVDATYAARDLSAAAYGGVAQSYVAGITSVHDSQVRTMRYLADSMADGALELGAAYAALTGH